jgi:hypothetical protein
MSGRRCGQGPRRFAGSCHERHLDVLRRACVRRPARPCVGAQAGRSPGASHGHHADAVDGRGRLAGWRAGWRAKPVSPVWRCLRSTVSPPGRLVPIAAARSDPRSDRHPAHAVTDVATPAGGHPEPAGQTDRPRRDRRRLRRPGPPDTHRHPAPRTNPGRSRAPTRSLRAVRKPAVQNMLAPSVAMGNIAV